MRIVKKVKVNMCVICVEDYSEYRRFENGSLSITKGKCYAVDEVDYADPDVIGSQSYYRVTENDIGQHGWFTDSYVRPLKEFRDEKLRDLLDEP